MPMLLAMYLLCLKLCWHDKLKPVPMHIHNNYV